MSNQTQKRPKKTTLKLIARLNRAKCKSYVVQYAMHDIEKVAKNNKMRNLRKRYTYKQRMEFDQTVRTLYMYIFPLLLARQHGACNRCKKPALKYDMDHKVYNPMC